jgi:D-alanyl-D-alanine dipeptidase
MTAFGPLEPFRRRAIPDQEAARALRKNYRAYAIATDGALYAEPLVDIHLHGIAGENYYASAHNPPYWVRAEGSIPDLLLRKTVAERLARVNARAGEAGLTLHVFDAWRPNAVQAYFHTIWMRENLARRRPDSQGEALQKEIERYWAAPTSDPNAPAPHATGSAVDLTLRWQRGDLLWMGSIFDDVTALAHRDRFERPEDAAAFSYSDEEARANRRLLHWLMVEEGFAAHPDEWWHFSWGDQFWAKLAGAPAAHYGWAAPQG